MAVAIIVGASPSKGEENQKNASKVCEILSHVNKILILRCYHINWQLPRILEKQTLLILCVDWAFRSRSDTIAGNRDHRERRSDVFRWPPGRGAVRDGTDLQKVGFVFLGRVMPMAVKLCDREALAPWSRGNKATKK